MPDPGEWNPDQWDRESGQLGAEDTLDDRGVADPLDEGWSPPERPWIGDGWGVTAREERSRESLSARLSREVPDAPAEDGDGLGDTSDTDGELLDDEVGDLRAGRLVARDAGGATDTDEELWAVDAGVDGGAASAEEAAVHVVGESRDREWRDR
jgi:hypothetical protein